MAPEGAAGTLSGILKRSRRLTRREEREFIRRAQAGDERAREAVIEGNLRLILYVAKRYHSTSLSLEDMVQEGVVGLADALERFNPDSGNSFSSYAVPWIRLRVGRAVYRMGRLIRLPERGERLLARWNQLADQAQDASQPALRVADVAERLGVTPETLQAIVEASHPIAPLHAPDGEGEAHGAEEYAAADSGSDPWAHLAREEDARLLRQAMEGLRPNYRRVLEASYGLDGAEPRTLNDLARQWGVTKQAVSGLRKRALESLRERMVRSY